MILLINHKSIMVVVIMSFLASHSPIAPCFSMYFRLINYIYIFSFIFILCFFFEIMKHLLNLSDKPSITSVPPQPTLHHPYHTFVHNIGVLIIYKMFTDGKPKTTSYIPSFLLINYQ